MTTEQIDAALVEAEAIVERLVGIAPRIRELQKAFSNAEFNDAQLRRYDAMIAIIDQQREEA